MIHPATIDPVIRAALKEDVGKKDITTGALIAPNLTVKADIEFKERGVLCGIELAERVFRLIDDKIRFLPVGKDGEVIEKGREVAYLEGSASAILIGERTALNFISHLSGIATLTREFVERVKGTSARILDTRKTTPGLRVLEKYAVAAGGGTNHRYGLWDEVLIKDNHLHVLRKQSIASIVSKVRQSVLKRTVVGIEVKNLEEVAQALKTSADYILLDNMSVETVREAIHLRRRSGAKTEYEVSGGIQLENVLEYAQTGVERISIGFLTHGAPSLDASLDIVG